MNQWAPVGKGAKEILMSSKSVYVVSFTPYKTTPLERHIIISTLQIRKLRQDKSKQLAKGHTLNKRWSWDQSLGHQVPESGLNQEGANKGPN